jgi:hypothetical protein
VYLCVLPVYEDFLNSASLKSTTSSSERPDGCGN